MPLAPTLTTRLFPTADQKLRDLLLVAAGAMLVGAALGSKRGFASLGLYTAFGLAGLPVFAGGASGLGYVLGPTGGYLLGFSLSAYAMGMLAERGLEREIRTSILPFAVGMVIIYALGAGWLAFYVGPQAAIAKGVLPFLPGDVIKLALAATTLPAAWKLAK